MRAAIYSRVSQDRRGEFRSVKEQYDECVRLCERNGWEIAGKYRDNDRSASRYATKERPDFERLMSELDQYDILVTWEASRATRDLEVYTRLRDACKAAGVKWCYSGQLHDLSKSGDRFKTGLDMLLAERESDSTSERVRRSTRAQAAAGKPHGRIPYGFARVYDPSTGSLVRQVPHPEESKIVLEAADRVLAGESLYSIGKDLRSRGLRQLDSTRIQQMLRNPTYCGIRVFRGEILGNADWDAIIPPEKWEAIQGILGAPDRPKFHGSEPVYLLTGIARCGACGGPVIRLLNKGRYSAYLCREKRCVGRSQPKVDELVVSVVKQILTRPDVLEVIHAKSDPDVTKAAERVAELEARLDGFYQQAAEGSLSATGLARVESSILSQLEAARTRLQAMRTPQRLTIADPGKTAAEWDTLPLLERRAVVRGLMEISILPARAKGVRFDPESIEIKQRF